MQLDRFVVGRNFFMFIVCKIRLGFDRFMSFCIAGAAEM